MIEPTEERFKTVDGLNIFFRCWRPQNNVRGVLVIVPGFNSHSGYYHWVANHLCAEGFAVYAIDLRGRGKSDGDRFFVEAFSEYVADLTELIALAGSRDPGQPIFLLGHSAGGVVATLYALANQNGLRGLVSESFAFQLPAPEFALAVIKGLSHLAPHAHVLHLKNKDFSRNPAAVQAMDEDPLIAHEAQPTQTLAALVRADEELKAGFANLRLPLLILHGTADKAAKPSGSKYFFDAAGSADKTLKLYEGAFHDPLNDLDRENVMTDIAQWFVAHLHGPKDL